MAALRRLRAALPPLALMVATATLCTGAAGAAPQDDRAGGTEPKAARDAAPDTQRPTWAIAHRVLTTGGVTRALDHGANALEIDATAWRDGWRADHDGTATSYGDTMSDMFDQVAKDHADGREVSFVWLDMKNPDWCDSGDAEWRHCSVAALRDLAREKLESQGIRVLYGFYGTEGGSGWKNALGDLNSKEAVSYSGSAAEVRDGFAEHGPDVPARQRIMDNGLFDMSLKFGTIREELSAARADRDNGDLAGTVGWTVAKGDADRTATLLDSSEGSPAVDSLIYGHRMSCYPDGVTGPKGCGTNDTAVREALASITSYVDTHPETRRMAGPKDIPFGS
ncbi:Phospholipase D precursor [Streptomyces sp. YIM 130001]|uniref:phospholipase n=1 Tax=Streptomyces sp. YIM 130001 TaxID=2259644 RepID=UPI000E64E238|nr:phospholipase [Streptomyces sp. YIM 130001]RII22130.1 Phospholipase D precursor [Streptomyces sp. YIM 130001]